MTVRTVTAAGVVSTLVTSPTFTASSVGAIYDAAADGNGNLFVAGIQTPNGGGLIMQVVISTGVVSQFAGVGTLSTMVDGPVSSATFNRPSGIVVGPDGAVYVADCNINAPTGYYPKIRRIASGAVTTIATFSLPSSTGWNQVAFRLAMDPVTQNIYVSFFYGHQIWKVPSTGGGTYGTPVFMAGGGTLVSATTTGMNSPGSSDGTGSNAGFQRPNGMALDASGNVWIADQNNNRIRGGRMRHRV